MDYSSNVGAGVQHSSQLVSLRMPTHLSKRSPVGANGARPGAVLYARVSSKEQEQGYSIPAQQELLRSYAAQRGIVIEREFLDAETAKTTGRPGFTAMISYLKAALCQPRAVS